jgi:hypothetical protein
MASIKKKKWMSELQEMRAIFRDCLPVGEDISKAEEYFNSLEEVICTNDFEANPDPLQREEFEHDDPDVQYSYISDAVFKERSSNRELRAYRQDVDDQPDVYPGKVPQLGGPITPDSEPIPECSESSDPEDDWREYSRNTSRKLPSWPDSEVSER